MVIAFRFVTGVAVGLEFGEKCIELYVGIFAMLIDWGVEDE